MQASVFILGLIASITTAIPTPETQSTCLNVREPKLASRLHIHCPQDNNELHLTYIIGIRSLPR